MNRLQHGAQAGALFLLLAGLASLTGCTSKSEREFVSSCQAGGAERSTCTCLYSSLEKHYSPEFMDKLGQMDMGNPAAVPDDFERVLSRSMMVCSSE